MAESAAPLVTVVIPCYNQAHFLPDAIESALAQTHPNVEVVVVNDGSTDDTSAVARAFGERVRLIEQPNTGLSGARNAGIQASSGEFIALLDSDDRLHPECVALRVAMLVAEPDAALVTGGVRFVDEALRTIEGRALPSKPTRVAGLREVVRANLGPTCGTIARRRAYELCGLYDPLLRSCEDWDAVMRLATRFRLLYDSRPLADLREVGGSMSRGHATMWDTAAAVMLKNRAYAPSASAFWVDSRIGMFNHLLHLMNRVREEETGTRRYTAMLGFALKRPASIPFFAAWALRVCWNVLRRPFLRST